MTLDDLILLRKKEIPDVEELLTNKNWNFQSAKEPDEDKLGILTFSYKKGNYDDKAESFIKYYYSDKSETKRLNVQVNKKEIYNLYMSRLKALGCKIISSKVQDGEIIKIYEGSTTILEVSIGTQKDDFGSTKTYYTFFIVEKYDYYRNFIKE